MKSAEQNYPETQIHSESKKSVVTRFLDWCNSQEKYRFGWLAAIIAGHGCIVTPLTLIAIIMSGNNLIFWFLALIAMGTSLVTNLAALPTKITIPVFFISIAIDLLIVISCFAAGFNIAATYQ